MKKVLLVSGGEIEDAFALQYIKAQSFSHVIAIDSGMEFLYRHGLKPDVIVGDFDSAEASVLEKYRQMPGIEWRKFQPKKDDTDTEIAVLTALEQGAEELHILGALGSRIDHSLANIRLLGFCMEKGVDAYLVDAQNRISMMNQPLEMEKDNQYGKYISLIPFMGDVEGLTLRGFAYPLTDYTMGGYSSIGISNEITEKKATITMEKGTLLLIESRDEE